MSYIEILYKILYRRLIDLRIIDNEWIDNITAFCRECEMFGFNPEEVMKKFGLKEDLKEIVRIA